MVIIEQLITLSLKILVLADKESLELVKECAEKAYQEVEGRADENITLAHRRTMDLLETALAWHEQQAIH